jgi:hypothetical protein
MWVEMSQIDCQLKVKDYHIQALIHNFYRITEIKLCLLVWVPKKVEPKTKTWVQANHLGANTWKQKWGSRENKTRKDIEVTAVGKMG